MSTFGDMLRRARRDAAEGDWSPPPGTHNAIVVEGDAFESRAGDVYAKTRLRYVAPGEPDDGREWDHLLGFRSPQQAQMNVAQLSVYGLSDEQIDSVDDADDLARHMAELAGVEVEVSCKSRDSGDGVWTSVNFSRGHGNGDIPADTSGLAREPDQAGLFEAPPPPHKPASAAQHDADDIPF